MGKIFVLLVTDGTVTTFLSRESSEYLWVIDNKFGKCYSDINLFWQICLLWISVWSVVDRLQKLASYLVMIAG